MADLPLLPVDAANAKPSRAVAPGDRDALTRSFIAAIGGEEAVLTDPTGAGVRVGLAIVDHILENPSRQDGRERYFGLLPGLIEDPAEIWIGWATNAATGKVAMRRRYVKLIKTGKSTTIGVVADADGREWSGYTFFRGSPSGAKTLRNGLLIYRRPAQKTEE